VVEWNGFFVPSTTPKEIVNKLADAVRKAVESPEVKQKMQAVGIEPVGNSPEEFAKFLQGQITRWSALVKSNNITLE